MKKPVNKFTLALWVVAVLVTASYVYSYFSIWQIAAQFAQQHDAHFMSLGGDLLSFVNFGLLPAVMITAFGYLIELVDQIRWNALRRQK